MKATVLLADFAESINGKLYVQGAGWTVCGPGPVTAAVAILFEVPWDKTNTKIAWELCCVTEDGAALELPGPDGLKPLKLDGILEVGRPPGMTRGTPVSSPLAVTFSQVPYPPGRRFVWQLLIDGQADVNWQACFETRPERQAGQEI